MGDVRIVIIGGGVVGCAVAMELSKGYDGIFLFEKNPGITQGENQSSRNSGVIHSGIYYDQATRPLKAGLCVDGNRYLYEFCRTNHVPFLKCGKLIVASSNEEDRLLDLYLKRASENKVPGVRKITAERVKELEPNVLALSALDVPGAGIVDSASFVYRLHTLAQKGGVNFISGTEVIGINARGGLYELLIRYPDGATDHVSTAMVINSAGVNADLVAKMINPRSLYEIDPILGESYKFYSHKREDIHLGGRNIYPTPTTVQTDGDRHFTVGIHLTPTLHDLNPPFRTGSTVTVGPRLRPLDDRNVSPEVLTPAEVFLEKVSRYFPGLLAKDLSIHQAGHQARLKGCRDFVIGEDPLNPGFVNLLGIDSPGLTSSISIAHRVRKIVDTFMEID
ncbi:MAG: FAD-dependent oxidoreductase [Deltaproteobacteria bacterium]|nr:FAD-dependent oxidoreductase [Deltaproteobacteria bacterium]